MYRGEAPGGDSTARGAGVDDTGLLIETSSKDDKKLRAASVAIGSG
jgi:hypothetical protein